MDIYGFKQDFQPNGINPMLHFDMINYSYNITQLIASEFKVSEKLDNDIIHAYLNNNPVSINNFNLKIGLHIDSFKDLPFNYQIMELHKKLKQAELEKDEELIKKLNKQIDDLEKMIHKIHLAKEDEYHLKKIQNHIKNQKLNKMINDKTQVNNHIEEKHFHENFSGIKDFFIKLFGT